MDNPMQPGNIHTTYAANNISNEFVYMCAYLSVPLILLFICIYIQYNHRVS